MTDRCPHIIRRGHLDDHSDFCELTQRISGRIQNCVLMSGEECKTWDEIKKEWEDGRD
ncbi:hypothetical protein LCGC14_0514510 [marine sediment metagenome]|uniref:Uncharacterized protein n=1 Tax=marine sediment metagenome TaxID=412755 RepID=A0A0F9SIM8_9ZZZZ